MHGTWLVHIAIYTDDTAAAEHYYVHVVGCQKRVDLEDPRGTRYYVNARQFIEVLLLPDKSSPNRLAHLAYQTLDVEALRLYLESRGIGAPPATWKANDGSRWFEVKDPEGNTVQFV
ncbi:MAG: VOC family protein [Nevskia sp.]|nr:VOC family protein [Nevskia sp.]